ncbi:threonine aldolase family protein [Alicyclobacillus dauci]|uniref:Low specificity L-threonine aldolase n=1 Tax=Alicyclobacillus dauci TaxID=1475485 RepID=A0ABY6Z6G8_9BACL|nr:low specificity L-threonine aldolase [Alicyclobacillus dauci]WAH37781.1 low specificity L-threonine aldolase [Alicyclobacillus dauci]
MAKRIDLRSDTVTQPTADMRRAMAEAEVGDDVYGEDPTVNRLETLAAEMLGKEAALFVTSGTQGNQVAIATIARTGEEVIAEAESHIFYYEAAAVSAFVGAQIRQVPGRKGVLQPTDIKQAIRPRDVHQPRTALICIENTHNRAGGTVTPVHVLEEISSIAKASGVPVHMDGARLFNAAVASGRSAKEIASHVDTVQFCLSKGLSAPVGSVLAGSKAFIDEARQWRKRMGGGLRQAGILAAPGILALTTMVDRLAEDHENARYLAEQLSALPGVTVDLETVQTNIVIADIAGTEVDVNVFVQALRDEGVLSSAFGPTTVRFVTNKDVSREDISTAVDVIANVLKQVR